MVRFGNLNDLEDVMVMLELCKKDMQARGLNIWNEIYPTRDTIYADLLSGNALVSEENGSVISFLVMYPHKKDINEAYYHDHGNYVFIHRVMTHPSFRRKGHAKKLLSLVEKQGFSSVRLVTRNTNVYSTNLYSSVGYKIVKTEQKDNVIMEYLEKMLTK